MNDKPFYKRIPLWGWASTILLVLVVGIGVLSPTKKQTETSPSEPSKENITTPQESTEGDTTPQDGGNREMVAEGRLLDKYDYSVWRKAEDRRFVAMFYPTFLPRDDTVLIAAMYELINQTYGKHTVTNLEPQLVERNGTNVIMLEGTDGDYFFLPMKEDTGEVISLVYWIE